MLKIHIYSSTGLKKILVMIQLVYLILFKNAVRYSMHINFILIVYFLSVGTELGFLWRFVVLGYLE